MVCVCGGIDGGCDLSAVLMCLFTVLSLTLPVRPVIPKRGSVFEVEINGFITHIYGNRFTLRAGERAAKRFKVRGNMDL